MHRPPDLTLGESAESIQRAARELGREAFAQEFDRPYVCFVAAEPTDSIESEFMTVVGDEPSRFSLRESLHVYPLDKRSGANPFMLMVTFGRSSNNDILIATAGVSKFHGYFTQDGEEWRVTDAGSTNGTFLEGERLPARKPTPLPQGAELKLGTVQAQILRGEALYDFLAA